MNSRVWIERTADFFSRSVVKKLKNPKAISEESASFCALCSTLSMFSRMCISSSEDEGTTEEQYIFNMERSGAIQYYTI